MAPLCDSFRADRVVDLCMDEHRPQVSRTVDRADDRVGDGGDWELVSEVRFSKQAIC